MEKNIGIFELQWGDDLGEGWMNIDNLKTLLFTKEKTRDDLLSVRQISERPIRVPEFEIEILPEDCDYIPISEQGFCVRHDGVQMDGKIYMWEKIKSVKIVPTGKYSEQ